MELTDRRFSNGVGLTRPRLAVGKDGGIKALKEGLHQRLHTDIIHRLLAGRFGEDSIKVKTATVPQGHFLRLWVSLQARLMPIQPFLRQQGSNANSYPDRYLLHWWLGLSSVKTEELGHVSEAGVPLL